MLAAAQVSAKPNRKRNAIATHANGVARRRHLIADRTHTRPGSASAPLISEQSLRPRDVSAGRSARRRQSQDDPASLRVSLLGRPPRALLTGEAAATARVGSRLFRQPASALSSCLLRLAKRARLPAVAPVSGLASRAARPAFTFARACAARLDDVSLQAVGDEHVDEGSGGRCSGERAVENWSAERVEGGVGVELE